MKLNRTLIASLLALGPLADAALLAADNPSWGKYADNHIYAQALANDAIAAHANIFTLSLHAVAPGTAVQTMIAANLDRIGKKDDGDDLDVVKGGKTILAAKPTDPTKFEVMMPLKDRSNQVIGLLVVVYKGFQPGSDESPYYLETYGIQHDLAAKIPAVGDLFNPTN